MAHFKIVHQSYLQY